MVLSEWVAEMTEAPLLMPGPQGYVPPGGGSSGGVLAQQLLSVLLNGSNSSTALGGGPNSSIEQVPVLPKDTQACILFRFVLYAVAMGILCVLGFVGNTLSFLVLRKDLSSPVASFLLEVLAVADNALLVLWLVHYSVRESIKFFGLGVSTHDAWIYTRVYTFPVMYIAQTATIWLTVVIALNRYMAVCLPYRGPHLCNINNVYKGVAIVILFSICYNVPRFFEIQIVHTDTGNGTWTTSWKRTALGSNKIYDQVYVDAFYYVFSFVLPLLTLAFVNTHVTIAYQAIRRRKRRMTSRRQENENNITLVMIIIVLIFMLCQAPARIVQIVWGYRYKSCQSYEFYLIHISNTLEVLNSSVNFVVYYMFRKRFRDIVWMHFCVGPLSRLNRCQPDRSATTEGLSLVQVEQTTAMIRDNVGLHTEKAKLEPVVAQHSLNGACMKDVQDAQGGQDDQDGQDDQEGQAALADEVCSGVADPCIENNNEDMMEDSPAVPLQP